MRAQTMSQKLGFVDPDKKTPLHDEIQQWVHKNFPEVLKGIGAKYDGYTYEVTWEYPLTTRGYHDAKASIIGYIDLRATRRGQDGKWDNTFYIEVKTTIPSVGELLRQLTFYSLNTGLKDCYKKYMIVVCPDDKHKELIENQGYSFYKYDPS